MKIEDLDIVDKQLMYKTYDDWPRIARESFEEKIEKIDAKDIDHIVFAGMGGSGTIGDTVESILSKQNIHVTVVKGYVLPKTVDSKTLVITTSVSGNTSETIEILKQVKDTPAKTIGFSSGGLLENYCEKNNLPFKKIDMVHSPRASFAKFLFTILNVIEPVLPIKQNDIEEAVTSLERTKQNIFSGNLNPNNIALDLAKFSKELCCIYYPDGLKATAIRYKNSLQENSKVHAMIEDVIESCHN